MWNLVILALIIATSLLTAKAFSGCVSHTVDNSSVSEYPKMVERQLIKNEKRCVTFRVKLSENTYANNGLHYVVCGQYFLSN